MRLPLLFKFIKIIQFRVVYDSPLPGLWFSSPRHVTKLMISYPIYSKSWAQLLPNGVVLSVLNVLVLPKVLVSINFLFHFFLFNWLTLPQTLWFPKVQVLPCFTNRPWILYTSYTQTKSKYWIFQGISCYSFSPSNTLRTLNSKPFEFHEQKR